MVNVFYFCTLIHGKKEHCEFSLDILLNIYIPLLLNNNKLLKLETMFILNPPAYHIKKTATVQ